jgi:hypothetical protein
VRGTSRVLADGSYLACCRMSRHGGLCFLQQDFQFRSVTSGSYNTLSVEIVAGVDAWLQGVWSGEDGGVVSSPPIPCTYNTRVQHVQLYNVLTRRHV